MNDVCMRCGYYSKDCDCGMFGPDLGLEPAQCSACGAYGCMEGDACLGCGQGCVTLPAEDAVEGDRLPRGVGYPDDVLERILG